MEIQFWVDNANSLFHQIFLIVMAALAVFAFLLGTTYNVINILVYYILIPSSWIYLISRKTSYKLNFVSLGIFIAFLCLPDLRQKCDYFFQKSVDFLNWTADIFGSNYIDMSVYICVLVVGIVYLILAPLTLPKKVTKIMLIVSAVIFGLYMLVIFPNFKTLLIIGLELMDIKY